MPTTWKPSDYPSLSPYLMVADAAALVTFATAAFDAVELRRIEGPDGILRHAELRIDDSVLMLSEAIPGWPAFPVWLHVYVADAMATYRRALAAGATSVQEPSQKAGDPDLRGGVTDPCGNTWWLSTQVG